MISLTREEIQDLNREFGRHPHPPSLYIQEYEGLTTKIHELQLKEQELQEKLQNPTPDPESPTNTVFSSTSDFDVTTSPSNTPTPNLTPSSSSGNLVNHAVVQVSFRILSYSNYFIDATVIFQSVPATLGSPHLGPRSPMRTFVKAYLPNQQTTSVRLTQLHSSSA